MSIPAVEVGSLLLPLSTNESRLVTLTMFRSWGKPYSIKQLARDMRQTEKKVQKAIIELNELGNYIVSDDVNVTTQITIDATEFIDSQRSKSKAGGAATKAAIELKKNIDKDQQKGTFDEPRARPDSDSGLGPSKVSKVSNERKEIRKEADAAPPSIESRKVKPEASPDSRTAIDLLNQLSGKAFKHQLRSDLNARISENGVQPVLDVITAKCSQWNDDTKMRQYLRPETLFNRTKFEGYLEASKSQPTPAAKTRSPEDQAAYEARLLVGLNSNGTKWSPPE